jgi:hypothetical protein
VLVEVGTVHDWTLPKWRLKLLADTEKLRCLDASDVEPLQVILVARSGRFPSDRAPWLAQVPSWTACNLTPRRAPMPAGGAVEVRGWFPARTSATSRVAQR